MTDQSPQGVEKGWRGCTGDKLSSNRLIVTGERGGGGAGAGRAEIQGPRYMQVSESS